MKKIVLIILLVISSLWGDVQNTLHLTQKEKKWLKSEPVIKFAVDPNWLPIEAIDPKTTKYEGMMADYLQKIQKLTTIEFQLVPTKTWKGSVELAKDKSVDMLAAVSITQEREKFLNFSNTTIRLTDAVIMKNTKALISDIIELKGLRIGVSKGTSVHNMLIKNYPQLKIVPLQGTYIGIDELNRGNIDAYVGNLEVINHIIVARNFLDLKVVLQLDHPRELHIALLKEYPNEALSIINKAINAISKEEFEQIRKAWIGLKANDEVDYIFLTKILFVVLILVLVIVYHNRHLQSKVDKKTQALQKQKENLERLMSQFDKNVIFSKTDLEGKIIYVSEAFCEISGYSKEELIGNTHSIMKDPSMPIEIYIYLWDNLVNQQSISLELKNRTKEGKSYWLETKFEPDYDKEGNHIGYSAIRTDITARKEFQELSEFLEEKVDERTSELNDERTFIDSLMNSQSNIVLATNGIQIKTVNKAFLDFFGVKDAEEFISTYGNCICDTFDKNAPKGFITREIDGKKWIDYVYENSSKIHKVMIEHNGKKYIFTITGDRFTFKDEVLKTAVFTNITELEKIKDEIESIHKNTKDSIEYASLIQYAIIPDNELFRKYFSEYIAIWHPKDIVGGDIYLFDELRDDNECLLMVIDCTGHGVPGAFVTMLVKAIERQITMMIKSDPDLVVSPAKILQIFNQHMKHLLKQEDENSISNAGFDGGVLYYNKQKNIVKYAGANTPLFYVQNNKVHTIKGDRYSIGYKKSDAGFEFKEHIIDISEDVQFYLTTDGYLDQNGGEKGFPFGRRKFSTMIEKHYMESLADQQEVFLEELYKYQGNENRNDDITLIGFKIKGFKRGINNE